jgi:hypothetical protein
VSAAGALIAIVVGIALLRQPLPAAAPSEPVEAAG